MTNATHLTQNFSPIDEICAYDALPGEVRKRISNAHYSISSKMALTIWHYTRDVKKCIAAIDQIEAEMTKGNLL